MRGNQGIVGIEPDVERVSLEHEATIGVLDGHGRDIGLEAHLPGGAHHHLAHEPDVGCMRGQRPQVGLLDGQPLRKGGRLPGHDALLVFPTARAVRH